jgi:YVTN family beta-propeller protein
VSIIDMNSNEVIATVYGFNLPMGIAVSPDYKWLYVTNSGSNSVTIINTTTYGSMGTIPVGKMPYGIAITPDGGTLYVVNNEDNTVSVINTVDRKVNYTVNVGNAPHGVRINPVNGDVYVANTNDNTVSVIRGREIAATIPVGKGPTNGMAVTPDGSRLLIANTNGNTVSIFNTTNNMVMKTLNVGSSPSGIAISSDGWYAYIANLDSQNISILQISDNTIRVSFNAKYPSAIAVRPDGKALYVVTMPDGKVTAMDSTTGETKATIDINAVDVGAMMVESSKLIDVTPPVTILKLYGINDTNGKFISEVTCNLTAVDYPSGTEITNIQYSLDGNTWLPYTGNITLKNPRSITLYYRASDKAGNVEIIKAKRITIVEAGATPTPSIGPSLPPKPTALPPEEIPTVTKMPVACTTPKPTGGFEAILAAIGILSTAYIFTRTKGH